MFCARVSADCRRKTRIPVPIIQIREYYCGFRQFERAIFDDRRLAQGMHRLQTFGRAECSVPLIDDQLIRNLQFLQEK